MSNLSTRVAALEARNKRVETDKAWEISLTRRVAILVLTYLSIGIYLAYIQIPHPWLNAIVPSVGFMLSTLTLPLVRQVWQKYLHTTNG